MGDMADMVNDDTPDERLKPTMPQMLGRLLKASIDKRERRITELEAMLKMKQDDWLEVCQEVDALKKKYIEGVHNQRIAELEGAIREVLDLYDDATTPLRAFDINDCMERLREVVKHDY